MLFSFGFWQGRRDDGGDGQSRSPRASGDGVGAGRFAFKLGLTSIGSIFVAALIAFVTIRLRSDVWRDDGMPGLPGMLWISTAFLAATSVAAELAYRASAAKRARLLLMTLVCSVAFCVCQWLGWRAWTQLGLGPAAPTLYAFSFYMMTGLHAFHVLGGIALSAWAFWCARARRLRLVGGRSELLRFGAQYWHFLGVVWLVTWAALEIAI